MIGAEGRDYLHASVGQSEYEGAMLNSNGSLILHHRVLLSNRQNKICF